MKIPLVPQIFRFIIPLLVVVVAISHYQCLAQKKSTQSQLVQQLNATTIESLAFFDTPIEEAFERIVKLSKLDLAVVPVKVKPPIKNQYSKVTLRANNLSAWEALRKTCVHANLRLVVGKGGEVAIYDSIGERRYVVADLGLDMSKLTAEEKAKLEVLRKTIIPSLEFADTPLRDALDFLHQKARDVNVSSSNPRHKGIGIILYDTDTEDAVTPREEGDGFGFEGGAEGGGFVGGGVGDTPITLMLRDVPVWTALRYTCKLAEIKPVFENGSLVLVPIVPVEMGRNK